MRKFKGVAVACGLIGMLVAATAAASWSQPLLVTQIEVDSTSTGNGTATYLAFNVTPNNTPTCGQTASLHILVGSADAVKAMTTLATAAFLSGKTLHVISDGACDGVFAHVNDLQMQ